MFHSNYEEGSIRQTDQFAQWEDKRHRFLLKKLSLTQTILNKESAEVHSGDHLATPMFLNSVILELVKKTFRRDLRSVLDKIDLD